MRNTRERTALLVLVLLAVVAGCTSRTREITKEQYVIADIICDRIETPDKKPTREELNSFVVATKDTFDTLKRKGRVISIAMYSKAVTLSNRIAQGEEVDIDELFQFVKQTRDAYGILLEEKK